MLCCIILMISARYNRLPGLGSLSRSYMIHERLWDHCQHMILRIMLGQEKGSNAKTRTPGTIEALLLLTEWNPRRMHFPPPNDGWDSDLLMSSVEEEDEVSVREKNTARGRWLEDVINPARRSGRMSWMLVGCALSLAHELSILDDTERDLEQPQRAAQPHQETRIEQRLRLRRLLYLYMEQLSSRLGYRSMIPQSLSFAALKGRPSSDHAMSPGNQWQFALTGWIELTRLVKSVSDMLYPSPSFTAEILRNGRYVSLIGHFEPLLSAWKEKYFNSNGKYVYVSM